MKFSWLFRRNAIAIIFACFFISSIAGILLSPVKGSGSEVQKTNPRLLLNGRDSSGYIPDSSDTTIGPVHAGEPVVPVSLDIDLRDLPQTNRSDPVLIPDFEPWPAGIIDPGFADPVLEAPVARSAIPAPATSFAGMSLLANGAGWPPDPNGDIGPNYYIQAVNISVAIYHRTGSKITAFQFNNLFSTASTPCNTGNTGDPIVLYDDVSGRWIITDLALLDLVNGPYYECIAVSKTSDPVSGGWWLYTVQAHPSLLNDYPKLSIWQDGIYMTANMFDILDQIGTATYEGTQVWAFNRDELISGSPLNFQYAQLGAAYASPLPANSSASSMPAAGTPLYLASLGAADLYTFKFAVDWTNPLSSTLTGAFTTTIAAYSSPIVVPQPAPGPPLTAIGDRLMAQLQYSEASGSGALWAMHSVSSGGVTGIRWYELRNLNGTPSVFQQGTFSPDSTHRWMGSLGVDQDGNMAVVYSASSDTLNPEIRYAGRLVTDTLGTLGQGEGTLIAGAGAQQLFDRWGDYASMSIDPLDECTFWFTSEYYIAYGADWQTRIGAFKYPNCPDSIGAGPHLDINANNSDVLLSWTPVLTKANGLPANISSYNVFSGTGVVLSPTYQITATGFLTYTDPGAASGGEPVFYQVSAEDVNGNTSEPSNIVGIFSYELVPTGENGANLESNERLRPAAEVFEHKFGRLSKRLIFT